MTTMAKHDPYKTQRSYTSEETNAAHRAALKLREALEVLVLTPHIRAYLYERDPQGLAQAEAALQLAGMTRAEARAEATKRAREATTAAKLAMRASIASCTSCGLRIGLTPDGRLYPWPDGAQLCWECHDKRERLLGNR
jgi:hypothetical protein